MGPRPCRECFFRLWGLWTEGDAWDPGSRNAKIFFGPKSMEFEKIVGP